MWICFSEMESVSSNGRYIMREGSFNISRRFCCFVVLKKKKKNFYSFTGHFGQADIPRRLQINVLTSNKLNVFFSLPGYSERR